MFKKHPPGLAPLFFTEMWERFSFYCMMALLTLYMDAPVAQGGLGFESSWSAQVYGLYNGLVYFTPLLGGLIADRFWGFTRTIIAGGLFMMAGHLALAGEGIGFFFLGLTCLIVGNGLFKPNISTMLGNLYRDRPDYKDQGFNIFYMGINIGAFVAPFVANGLKNLGVPEGVQNPEYNWHLAFGIAAAGMFISLVIFLLTQKLVAAGERRPEPTAADPSANGDAVPKEVERLRIQALFIVFGIVIFFWMAFKQNGVTIVRWARDHTEPFWGIDFGQNAALSLAINPALVVLLTPLLLGFWNLLGRLGWVVSTPRKMLIGMLLAAGSTAVMAVAATHLTGGLVGRVSVVWMFSAYVLVTLAELCLSPIGLSLVSKLAPPRYGGLLMGGWFVSTAIGVYLSGAVGSFWKNPLTPQEFFTLLCGTSLFAGVLLLLALRRLEAAMPKPAPAPAPDLAVIKPESPSEAITVKR